MNGEPSRQHTHRRYRRRILGWGTAALMVVFVLGSVITVPRVESELEDLVDAAAAAAGAVGVTSSFSGQDGTVRCDEESMVGDELLAELGDLRGVRKLTLHANCGATSDSTGDETPEDDDNTEPSTPPTSSDDTVVASSDASDGSNDGDDADGDAAEVTESVLDVVRNDSQFSTLSELIDDAGIGADLTGSGPITLFAPTNDAFQALGPDTIAALGRDPDLLSAVLRHHATAAELSTDGFVVGDIEMLDGTSVTISPGEAAADAVIVSGDVTAALTIADIPATNGVVHGVDAVLLPPGFVLPGATVVTSTTIPAPIVADDGDAAQLESELNAFVAANPILFEPGSTDIATVSQPAIDQIAVLATQLTGINIEVQGHTDTDGNPDRNQTLSENRAASVRDALIAAGVDAGSVTSIGFGGTRTIVDASGVEDKAASRRVEFVVTTV